MARLNEQLLLVRETVRNLTESLALANSEAEVFKRQAEDLQTKFDALAPAAGPNADMEQRLLSMANEMGRQQKENALLVERMLALSESVQVFLKSMEAADSGERETFEKELERKASQAGDPAAQAEAKSLLDIMARTRTAQAESRAALETQLRAVSRLLGAGEDEMPMANQGQATLTDASVIEVKPEFSLVVANIGRETGVRMGMPFQVWRGNRRIGDVRVIDVRDRISGAVTQNLVSEEDPIRVGDRLRVDARR